MTTSPPTGIRIVMRAVTAPAASHENATLYRDGMRITKTRTPVAIEPGLTCTKLYTHAAQPRMINKMLDIAAYVGISASYSQVVDQELNEQMVVAYENALRDRIHHANACITHKNESED